MSERQTLAQASDKFRPCFVGPSRAYDSNVAKQITRKQAQRKKAQASAFMERIGEPARAKEFADMSVDEYAEHKGIRLANRTKRRSTMAGTATTKADLQDQIDDAISILEDAYTPETSREEMAAAIGNALDSLRGEDEDADEEDEESEDDEEDDDRE